MIWILLLPVPDGPLTKVWGSTLPSLLINIQPCSSQLEIHRHLHHHFCIAHPQRTGGVHQVKILIIIIFPY